MRLKAQTECVPLSSWFVGSPAAWLGLTLPSDNFVELSLQKGRSVAEGYGEPRVTFYRLSLGSSNEKDWTQSAFCSQAGLPLTLCSESGNLSKACNLRSGKWLVPKPQVVAL